MEQDINMKNPGIVFLSAIAAAFSSLSLFLVVLFAQWGFSPSTWPEEGRMAYALTELCMLVFSVVIGFAEGHRLNDLLKEDT